MHRQGNRELTGCGDGRTGGREIGVDNAEASFSAEIGEVDMDIIHIEAG